MRNHVQIVLTIIIMALISFIVIVMAGELRNTNTGKELSKDASADKATDAADQTISAKFNDEGTQESITLNIWYTNEKLHDYLNKAIEKFKIEYDYITVDAKLMSTIDYFEAINEANIRQKDLPDVYLVDCEDLEKAFLAGLTTTNKDATLYSTNHYPQTALSAVTYNNKMVAFPLCFQTSFLIYNEAYVKNAPATFEDIIDFAEKFDGTNAEDIQYILEWDTKDLLYNYGFIGEYAELGGENGDDPTILDLTNKNLKKACKYYHDLSQYFSIDSEQASYKKVVEDFTAGKTVYAIAGIDAINILSSSEVQYGISAFPDLTEKLKSKALSRTEAMVVNPYSNHSESANKLAQFITYDCAEELYSLSGIMPCKILEAYSDENLKKIMDQYDDSKSLPKLIKTSDYWLELQNSMNKIWEGEKVNKVLESLSEKIETNLAATPNSGS